MKIKMIIITIVAAVICFAGTFFLGLATNKKQAEIPPQPQQLAAEQSQIQTAPTQNQDNIIPAAPKTNVTISMSEQQLNSLIHDLRIKMQDYEQKLQSLNQREQQLQIAQDVLKQDIIKLTNLQTELASITSKIKTEQDKLSKSKLEINQIEKTNFVLIASAYDKMDSASASKILANMCMDDANSGQAPSSTAITKGYDDAVRILYYMTDRTKANLLAEIANSEPQLASSLSQRLKQITEVN